MNKDRMFERLCNDYKNLEYENKRLREALEWYAENVIQCNLMTSKGDTARDRLAKDHGTKANEALKEDSGEQL
jgi:hypothetical protein